MNSQTSNNKLFASLLLVTAISFAIYMGADKSIKEDQFLFATPERLVMASPIGSFNELNPSSLIEKLDRSLDMQLLSRNTIVETDTIDEKELKQKVKEYEKAVERLQASKEWQELESLRKDMFDEQLELMKELTPQIEEAMRAADIAVKMEAAEMAELKEKMAAVQIEMSEMEFNEEIVRAMELSARMIEESMAKVEVEMEKISSAELESMAREYAMISEKYAHEAEKMAREAEEVMVEAQEVAEKAESFIKELKSELIKDGYINKKDDLDDLKFEDGKVYINDKAVKDKDAKKYYDLKSKYLGKDSGYFSN